MFLLFEAPICHSKAPDIFFFLLAFFSPIFSRNDGRLCRPCRKYFPGPGANFSRPCRQFFMANLCSVFQALFNEHYFFQRNYYLQHQLTSFSRFSYLRFFFIFSKDNCLLRQPFRQFLKVVSSIFFLSANFCPVFSKLTEIRQLADYFHPCKNSCSGLFVRRSFVSEKYIPLCESSTGSETKTVVMNSAPSIALIRKYFLQRKPELKNATREN